MICDRTRLSCGTVASFTSVAEAHEDLVLCNGQPCMKVTTPSLQLPWPYCTLNSSPCVFRVEVQRIGVRQCLTPLYAVRRYDSKKSFMEHNWDSGTFSAVVFGNTNSALPSMFKFIVQQVRLDRSMDHWILLIPKSLNRMNHSCKGHLERPY